jgi:hypothetical protein
VRGLVGAYQCGVGHAVLSDGHRCNDDISTHGNTWRDGLTGPINAHAPVVELHLDHIRRNLHITQQPGSKADAAPRTSYSAASFAQCP